MNEFREAAIKLGVDLAHGIAIPPSSASIAEVSQISQENDDKSQESAGAKSNKASREGKRIVESAVPVAGNETGGGGDHDTNSSSSYSFEERRRQQREIQKRDTLLVFISLAGERFEKQLDSKPKEYGALQGEVARYLSRGGMGKTLNIQSMIVIQDEHGNKVLPELFVAARKFIVREILTQPPRRKQLRTLPYNWEQETYHDAVYLRGDYDNMKKIINPWKS